MEYLQDQFGQWCKDTRSEENLMPDKIRKQNQWENRFLDGLKMILFICIILFGFTNSTISQTLSQSEAVKVLESLDKSYDLLRWKCRIERNIKISDSDETGSSTKKKSDLFEEYSVLYDVKRKHFCVEGNMCIPWIQGESPTITRQIGYSYDGEKYISWEKRKGKTDQENHDSGTAIISSDIKQVNSIGNFIKTNGACVGYGIGFPMQVTLTQKDYFGTMSVYDLVRKWSSDRLLSINVMSDGKWMIEGHVVWINGADRTIRFVCDINEGGCVCEFVRLSKFSGKDYIENKILAGLSTKIYG